MARRSKLARVAALGVLAVLTLSGCDLNNEFWRFGWPEGITEVPALRHLDGRTAHFADGTRRDVDAIILCTGYQHHFPFIDPTCDW